MRACIHICALLGLLALAGCDRPQIDYVLPAPKPPAPVEQLLPDEAVQLIVEFEVGSAALYDQRFQAPIWPGAASGVTVGIGYDLGHQWRSVILQDWWAEPERERLADQAGITGPAARDRLPPLQDIRIPYREARAVFDDTSLVKYYRLMLRTFPGAEKLHGNAQGALTSLVYNRGGSLVGDSRREMRLIAEQCVPAGHTGCIAYHLRAMKRVWVGSKIERGMSRRRDAEAALAERAP